MAGSRNELPCYAHHLMRQTQRAMAAPYALARVTGTGSVEQVYDSFGSVSGPMACGVVVLVEGSVVEVEVVLEVDEAGVLVVDDDLPLGQTPPGGLMMSLE